MTAALHPDLAKVAETLREAGIAPVRDASIQQTRDYVDRANAFTGRASVPLADERSIDVVGVPAKLYWPDRAMRPPLLFYAHGGGWRQGTLAGWDAPLRQIVRDSGVAVLSIDYALAPEHKFPIAFDQVLSVMRAAVGNGAVDGRAVSGFAAGGDSAGANLILGAAIALRDAGIDALRHLMLLYGVYSKDVSRASWGRLSGFGLSVAAMEAIWAGYLGAGEDDWRVQPLDAAMRGLPPARLVVGDLDPLLDENIALHAKLRAEGVPADLTVLPGVNHGVVRWNEDAPVVRELLSVEARALAARFSRAG